jgi:hypothetical protein
MIIKRRDLAKFSGVAALALLVPGLVFAQDTMKATRNLDPAFLATLA